MDRTFYLPTLGQDLSVTDSRHEVAADPQMADLRNRMLQELQMFLTVELAGPREPKTAYPRRSRAGAGSSAFRARIR